MKSFLEPSAAPSGLDVLRVWWPASCWEALPCLPRQRPPLPLVWGPLIPRSVPFPFLVDSLVSLKRLLREDARGYVSRERLCLRMSLSSSVTRLLGDRTCFDSSPAPVFTPFLLPEHYLLPFHPCKSIFKAELNGHLLQEAFPTPSVLSEV